MRRMNSITDDCIKFKNLYKVESDYSPIKYVVAESKREALLKYLNDTKDIDFTTISIRFICNLNDVIK